jgi:hypothetical protein
MGFFLFRINGLAHKFGIKGHEFPLKRKFQTLVDKHIKLNLSAESPRGKVFLLVTTKLLKFKAFINRNWINLFSVGRDY